MGKRTCAVQTESKMMAGGECLDREASPSKEGVEGRLEDGRGQWGKQPSCILSCRTLCVRMRWPASSAYRERGEGQLNLGDMHI